jgi:hypothetical protein
VEKNMGGVKKKIEKGEKIGYFTYVQDIDSTSPRRRCEFLCFCGKTVIADLADVRRKKKQSCGCVTGELITKAKTTHGHSIKGKISSEYSSYNAMITRCENPHVPSYKRYGGRGIKVCDRWKESFSNFLQDMGKKPTPKHSIERIDNNGNYEPGNCKWATTKEQSLNRSSNCMVLYKEESKPLQEWIDILNLPSILTRNRIDNGWTPERAFETPMFRSSKTVLKVDQFTLEGVFIKQWQSTKEISKYYKVHKSCITDCINGKTSKSKGFLWKYSKE